MHGNAWEMCLDRATWEVGPGAIRHLVNEVYIDGIEYPLATKGTDVIVRGGAWLTPVKECRSANRSGMDDKNEYPEYSMRPVLAPSN